jgi:hypothetical protein
MGWVGWVFDENGVRLALRSLNHSMNIITEMQALVIKALVPRYQLVL